MKIYLAARYGRRLELCEYREQLQALGYVVQATWLNGGHQISDDGTPIGDHGEALVEGDDGSTNVRAANLRSKFARDDMLDVLVASCLIAFSEPPRSSASRGSRHVEFGLALNGAFRGTVRLIVVGPRENIFHWLPEVEHYDTWQDCLSTLKAEA